MSGKKYVVRIELLMEYEVELDESELSRRFLENVEEMKTYPK